VAFPDLVHIRQEAHHLAHGLFLGAPAPSPQLLDELRELNQVVEEPVAPDHRGQHTWGREVERARRAGELHDPALHLSHGREPALGHRDDSVAERADDLEPLAALREVRQ
jgi:hypothetical protein